MANKEKDPYLSSSGAQSSRAEEDRQRLVPAPAAASAAESDIQAFLRCSSCDI